MAALAVARPVVFGLEVDRRRHAEKRRKIARALPLQPALERRGADVGVEAGVAAHRGGAELGREVAPAHHRGVQIRLSFRPGVQEGGALGRAQPLVAVAGVQVRADGHEIELDLPWGVCAVDQRRDAHLTRPRAQPGHGEHQRGGGADVAGELRSQG